MSVDQYLIVSIGFGKIYHILGKSSSIDINLSLTIFNSPLWQSNLKSHSVWV